MVVCHLQKLMDEKNVNQNEIYSVTKIRPQTLSNLRKSNMKQVPVDAIDKLCKYFDCSIADIIEYKK